MNHELISTTTIEINASKARVWKVMTNPALIKVYLHGAECITDWQVGSTVVFQGEYEGHKYSDHGVVQENRTEELLSYTYWTGFSGLPDTPENYCLVTYTLENLGDELTKFSWIQKGFADDSRLEHSKQNMPEFLKHIKRVAEEQ